MKIRMITFHTPINYGAVLQAYALQTYLKTQCEDVKIINYKTDTLIQKYKYFKKNNTPRNIIGNIVKLKDYSKYKTRKRKFEEFSNTFYDLTERVTDREGCSKEARNADFVFTGSDQVFNPTRKYQEEISTFYLDFDVGKAKRVAYAPSFGVGSIPIGKRDMVKNYLEKFDYLSVRELNGKDIVKSLIGKDPLCVVDPVLLLQEKQWESIEKKVEVPENYLLCYHLYNSTLEKEVVEKVAQKLGLKIVCITPSIFSPIKSDICFKDVGPEEFVYLLRHASFVVTDSFHGVIFSTLFKKQFYLTVASESTKSRMVSFLNRMGMEKRICIDSDDIDEEPIDYSIVTPLLNREIELSKQYITDCLNGQDVTVLKNVIEEKPIKTIEDIQNYCTGCGTCIAICPTNAITMQKNKEGFEVPVIDKEKCIQCGKCVKMCHANKYSNTRNNANIEKAFYGRIKDNKEVLNYSSSGGIYYVLANKTIKEGGITYGAVLNKENWKVEHLSSEESSLKAQMKSKYVQSSTYKAFAKVKEDLEKGKQVLFCGTPCQVAGLKKLVGERENLITIDFICHGVPSPAILKDKIAEMAKKDAQNNEYMGNEFKSLRKSEISKVAPDRAALIGKFSYLTGSGNASVMKEVQEADKRWLCMLFGEPYEAKCQGKGFGSAVHVYNEDGEEILTYTGGVGWQAKETKAETKVNSALKTTYYEAYSAERKALKSKESDNIAAGADNTFDARA